MTQEYTHAYLIRKIIAENKCTWVRFKAHFKESHLDREELLKRAGAAGYGSANNMKHREM